MNRAPRTSGFILISVLILVMLASMLAVSLLFRLKADEAALQASANSEQAWLTALSGVHHAMHAVATMEPGSLNWQSNPQLFKQRLLLDDGVDRWFFTIYSSPIADLDEPRLGLSDHASKLNVNSTPAAIVNSILEAEATSLPFTPTNSISSEMSHAQWEPSTPATQWLHLHEYIEQNGLAASSFYGEDANSNFQLDPNEDDEDQRLPSDNSDGRLDLGLRKWLTVSSYDLNVDQAGNARINLNDPNNSVSSIPLPETTRTYIAAARRDGVRFKHPSELLDATGQFKDPNGVPIELRSGVTPAELHVLLDRCTTTDERELPGLINLNTAPARVVAAALEIGEDIADAIVSARTALNSDQRTTTAWLVAQNIVDAPTYKRIAPKLTTRSYQFECHVVGYAWPSGQYRILQAEFDMAARPPRITSLRELTRLGLPFRIEPPDEDLQPQFDSAGQPSKKAKHG